MQTNSYSSCYPKARQSTLSKYLSPQISRDDWEGRRKQKAEGESNQQLICGELSRIVRPKGKVKNLELRFDGALGHPSVTL